MSRVCRLDKGKKAYLAGRPAQRQEAVRDTVCVRTTRNSVQPKSRAHGRESLEMRRESVSTRIERHF